VSHSYRKKPVIIEAHQNIADDYGALADKSKDKPKWLVDAITLGTVQPKRDGTVHIATLEGTMIANDGDWIIKGVKGELYPCKPDIFEQTYEPA
jgi:hypothetical protein